MTSNRHLLRKLLRKQNGGALQTYQEDKIIKAREPAPRRANEEANERLFKIISRLNRESGRQVDRHHQMVGLLQNNKQKIKELELITQYLINKTLIKVLVYVNILTIINKVVHYQLIKEQCIVKLH